MAPDKTSLKEVVSTELDKSVGFLVRVVRLWSVPHWGNEEGVYAIHMLIQDEKGVRIQASIEEALIDKFKTKIEEHGFYAMKNFRVAVNQEKFRPAVHPFRFHFQQNTKVLPAKKEQLHSNALKLYKTLTIAEIIRIPPSRSNDLIDFIGAYFPNDGMNEGSNTQKTSKYVSFHLKDVSQQRIYCSLWDRYGQDAKAILENFTGNFAIVLLHLCRVSRRGNVSLGTSFHVSKVVINEHIPEIEDFRREFSVAYESSFERKGKRASSSTSSSVKAPGPLTTISKLAHGKEGFYFYGEITRVVSMDAWYIKACPNPNCDIKVDEVEDGHFCSKCQLSVRDPLHKYKIKCEVKDNDKDTRVVLNDEDCYRIIGKSASELLALMHQNVPMHKPPKDVMDFVGRSFLFRVGGSTKDEENVRTYNIDSVCDDPSIVAANQPTKYESSDEDLDSDDDLSLMLQNTTEVDSNGLAKVDEDSVITPSSKRHRTEESSDSDATPTTQGSTSMKLKAVKVEEA